MKELIKVLEKEYLNIFLFCKDWLYKKSYKKMLFLAIA
jgi:hypothetical protein